MRRHMRETTPGVSLLDAEGDDPLAAGARRLQAMIESRFGRVQANARDGTILACSESFAVAITSFVLTGTSPR